MNWSKLAWLGAEYVTWLSGAWMIAWASGLTARDAHKAACLIVGDGFYTAQAAIQARTTPCTAGYLTGGQNNAIELPYAGNGQFVPLSYVGTISSY